MSPSTRPRRTSIRPTRGPDTTLSCGIAPTAGSASSTPVRRAWRPTGSFAGFVSGDGRYVAFESSAGNLVPGVTGGVQQVYRKDTTTGRSCSSRSRELAGAQANSGREVAASAPTANAIVYTTKASTLSRATTSFDDVYLWDESSATKTSMISHGAPTSGRRRERRRQRRRLRSRRRRGDRPRALPGERLRHPGLEGQPAISGDGRYSPTPRPRTRYSTSSTAQRARRSRRASADGRLRHRNQYLARAERLGAGSGGFHLRRVGPRRRGRRRARPSRSRTRSSRPRARRTSMRR